MYDSEFRELRGLNAQTRVFSRFRIPGARDENHTGFPSYVIGITEQ